MYSGARVQELGYEPVRADVRSRHCLLRDGGVPGHELEAEV